MEASHPRLLTDVTERTPSSNVDLAKTSYQSPKIDHKAALGRGTRLNHCSTIHNKLCMPMTLPAPLSLHLAEVHFSPAAHVQSMIRGQS